MKTLSPCQCKTAGSILLGIASALLYIPGTVYADHFTGQCATELNAVEQAITDGNFLGKRATTDQSNLLVKLEAANAKIAQLKYSDAIDKLTAISDTATALAGAVKPKLEDATTINTTVAGAVSCAGLLQ